MKSRATLLPMLVHCALRDIDASRPWRPYGIRFDPNAYIDFTDTTEVFFRRAVVAATLVPVSLALTVALAWQWRRGVARRLLLRGPLGIGLWMTATFTVWTARGDFAEMIPGVAPFIAIKPIYRRVLRAMAISLVAAAGGAPCCYRANGWKPILAESWERRPGRYLHQRTPTLFAVIGVCTIHIIATVATSEIHARAITERLLDVFYLVYNAPTLLLELAILRTAIRLEWRNRRRAAGDYAPGPFAMSLPAWAVVSRFLFVTIASGLPVICWFSFAGWLQSWRM